MYLQNELLNVFVMYYTYGVSGPSLLIIIESIDSMIFIYLYEIVHSNGIMRILTNNWKVKIVTILDGTRKCNTYVTVHEKTKHNALKIIFELRRPLPTTTFKLLLLQI